MTTIDLPTSRDVRFRLCCLLATVAFADVSARGDEPLTAGRGPVARVFILAGQSNMEGQAVVDLDGDDYNGGRGTLAALARNPANASRLSPLRTEDGSWRTRDDVIVRYRREDQPLLMGPLGIGYAVYGGRHHFGAELAFGHVVGDHLANHGEPVLLVKTAWGGKSLFADFRPPSVGPTVDTKGHVVPAPGAFYTAMIEEVKAAVAAVPEIVPGAARGELAGFVWWHGWNDGVDPDRAVPAYEANLAALIRDVRRDLAAPRLPVVIGELTGPWVDAPESWERLRRAQAAVAEADEFRDTARFVPTRQFVRAAEDSPNPGHGHHEFGNAETYLLVGEALGRAMVSLMSGEPAAATIPYAAPIVASPSVGPVPDAVRERLRLSDRYTQYAEAAGGIAVVSTDRTQPEALAEAAWLIGRLTSHRPEIARAIAASPVRFVVMAHDEFTTDVAEHADLEPAAWWDRRARGLGATLHRPATSCGEENLLCFAGDPYATENILIHEFAHTIHQIGLAAVDATFERRLDEAFAAAVREGRWAKTYARENAAEYWAEGVQSWFSCNRTHDDQHGGVNSPQAVREHDPPLAALLEEVFGADPVAYCRPHEREPDGRRHLGDFDRGRAPRFDWANRNRPGANGEESAP